MREIFALAIKDLRLLTRDKAGFFFTLFFPLLIAIFFGTIFSGSGDSTNAIPILLVDEDKTPESHTFVAELDSAEEIQVEESNRATAVEQVRRGKKVAFVVLKKGFGEARKRVFWGNPPQVELGVDPARKAEKGMLQGILTKYAVEGFQQVLGDQKLMQESVKEALNSLKKASDLPVEQRRNLSGLFSELDRFLQNEQKFESKSDTSRKFSGFQPLVINEVKITTQRRGPANYYSISFPQGIIWGILGTTITFGISLVVERTRGTLLRLRCAPIGRLKILAGKGLACFITTNLISIILFAIAFLFFEVIPNSFLLLLLAIISTSIAFVGIMMFLSVLGKTEQAASGISWAIMMILTMIGGGMIPIFILPGWMRTLSNFSPVKWAILGMEGAIWRDFSLQEMLLPVLILIVVGVVFFIIGVRAFRWTEQG